MADYVYLVSGPGAVWSYALALWVQFAEGDYTSWAFTRNNVDPYRGETITLGLVGGGTDTYTYFDATSRTGNYQSIGYVFGSPGWRATVGMLLNATLPDGNPTANDYGNGPILLRQEIVLNWSGITADTEASSGFGPVVGVSARYWVAVYVQDLMVTTDTNGVYYGLGGVTGMNGYPSDFVGGGGGAVAAIGGGSGSADLSPVVDAINGLVLPLNDIALIDVEYVMNNGKAAISLRGKTQSVSGLKHGG